MTDRAQLLVLFKSDLISPLFQAVEAANLKTMQGEDDQHYLFLKRMVQILVELGGQVCGIWSASPSSVSLTASLKMSSCPKTCGKDCSLLDKVESSIPALVRFTSVHNISLFNKFKKREILQTEVSYLSIHQSSNNV